MKSRKVRVWLARLILIIVLAVFASIIVSQCHASQPKTPVEELTFTSENNIPRFNYVPTESKTSPLIVNQFEVATNQSVDPAFEIEITEPTNPMEYIDVPELDYDFGYVVRVVGAEARGEPFDGIMAVAQTIATRVEKTGLTPEEVVKQKINGVRQYTDPMPEYYFENGETVNEACLRVLVEGETVFDEPVEYFCTPSANKWHRGNLKYVGTIGGHEFYAEKG